MPCLPVGLLSQVLLPIHFQSNFQLLLILIPEILLQILQILFLNLFLNLNPNLFFESDVFGMPKSPIFIIFSTGSSNSVISSSYVSLSFPYLLSVSSVLFFTSSSSVVSSFSSRNSLLILSISSKTGSISSSVLLHTSVTSFPDSLLPKSSVSTLILISFPVPVTLKIPSLFT